MSTPERNDPEALLAHGTYVRGLARELVFDAALARDVEQETWLAALEQTPRDPAATRGWLAAIVRNLARRAWRTSARRRAHEAAGAELERVVPSPEEVLEREELRARVVAAVNGLEEPYRAALVLRWLEGHDPREVARRLGVPLETAKTRLKRGLELLRARLDRENRGERGAWCLLFVRGFGLGPPSLAKLLGVALSTSFVGTSGVLSMAIVKKAVLASVVLASAATLFVFTRDAESSSNGARGSRIEPAELVAAEAAGAPSIVAAEFKGEAERESVAEAAPASNTAQDPDVVTVSGRVLDPDGKPLAGAEMLLTRLYYDERLPKDPLAVGKSDERGAFTLTYRKSDRRFRLAAERPEMWRHVTVSAFVPGFAPDWEYLATWPEGKALELRVVRDIPLTGRLLDLEGRPLAGVRVSATGVGATESNSLDDFLKDPRSEPTKSLDFPPQYEPATETDADGRFVLHGFGAERFTRLVFSGETVTWTPLDVVTRPVEPGGDGQLGSEGSQRFGNGFEWVLQPTRPITGIVRDAASGEPLADVEVRSQIIAGVPYMTDVVRTRTDANGRFRLVGMPKGAGNQLLVMPNDEQPYFMQEVEVPDPAGMGPVEVEAKLTRGLWITGRVTDKATGEPVYGRLHYLPFLDNANAVAAFGLIGGIPRVPGGMLAQHHYKTDADGRFRLVGLPGPAIVGVVAIGPYMRGAGALEIEGRDEEGNFATFESPVNASVRWPTAMRKIDPGTATSAITCDLEVDPGETLTVELVDARGQALEHCAVRGSAGRTSYGDALDAGPKVAITQLGPGEARVLRIHQSERCLGLAATVTLEEGPRKLVLQPCTTVVGRLLDEAGAPIGGVPLEASSYRDYDRGHSAVSEPDGRFRLEHVVPGVPIHFYARSEVLQDSFQVVADPLEPTGGVMDLGDVVLKLR